MDPSLPPNTSAAPTPNTVKPNPFGGNNAPAPAPAPGIPRSDPFGGNNAPAPAPAPPAPAPKAANPAPPLPAPDVKGILGDAKTGAIAAEVLRLVNIERSKRKLPQLGNNIRLSTASWLHSQEMYVKRYFSHESPTKGRKQFTDRIRNAGVVGHGAAGENIAMTHVSRDVAKRLVKMWMDSPGHRANILHKDFRFSGLGIYGDGDYIYATQVFTQKVKTPGLNKRTRTAPKRPTPAVIGPTKVI